MSDVDQSRRAPRSVARERLALGAFAVAAAYAAFLAMCLVEGYWLIDSAGRPFVYDFVAVWSGGKLALAGHAADAYDWTLHRAAEVEAVGQDFGGYYGWHYPPTFLFIAAALATLPYLAAEILWLMATLPAYLFAIRAIIGERLGIVLGLAFPGVIWNIAAGQNGFFTAALIAGVVVNFTRRPVVAGIFLGLLTYKPQFGLLFPVVLAFDGQWRVLAVATATAAALVFASLAAFGAESWHAFIAWLPVTSAAVFGEGLAGLNKLQSLFGVVRWLGGGMATAWVAQSMLIAGAATGLFLIDRHHVRHEIKAAALAVAALMATPYLYIYDFPVLAIPIAYLIRLGLREGFLAHELTAIMIACALVLAFPLLAVPSGFAAAVIIAGLVARRAFLERSAVRLPASQAVTATDRPITVQAAPTRPRQATASR